MSNLSEGDTERLRDMFAAAALTGMLASDAWAVVDTVPRAYKFADDMLKHRDTAERWARTGERAHEA